MNITVSRNCEIMLDTLFRIHKPFFPNFCLIFMKIKTSMNSAIVNAVRLAKEMRADLPKIVSYAASVPSNRFDGGREIDRSEKRSMRAIMNKPDRIILRVRSFPYTSVMTSLILKITGIKNIATLAFSVIGHVRSGNVLAPINSDAAIQNIYIEMRRSSFWIRNIAVLYYISHSRYNTHAFRRL